MYQPIDDEFIETSGSNRSVGEGSLVNTVQQREVFATSLLSKFLNEKKLKDIESIADRIKYKRHQIDTTIKSLNKEKKKRGEKKRNAKPKFNLSKRVKKRLNLYKLDKREKLNYADYEKLNEAWLNYAISCLLTCLPKGSHSSASLDEANVLNCLKQMDYHGCVLSVVKSTSSSLIGTQGIVLQEKRNVFYLLSRENQIKIVPKSGTLFEFELFDVKMILVGSNMIIKPELRVTKHARIKTKKDIL